MNLNSLTVGGVEHISHALLAGTEISQDLGGRVAECSVVISQGKEGAIVGRAQVGFSRVAFAPPAPQAEIIIRDNSSVKQFAGHVAALEPSLNGGLVPEYRLKCQDYTRLLESVMIESEVYSSKTDEFILDDLFATYLPEISTSDVASVATIDSIEFSDLTLREAIERIQERTGAEWYIDFDKKLQYYSAGAKLAPWAVTEGDPTYGPLNESVRYEEDFSNPANRVTVVGIGAETSSSVLSVNPSIGSDDGATLRQQAAYPPDGGVPTTNTTDTATGPTRSFLGGQYFVGVGLIRFDTSAIPDDAVIISATLKIWVNSMTFVDSGDLRGEYYNAGFWPIDNSDYTSTVSDNAIAAQPLFAFATGQYNNLALKDPSTNISLVGYTGLRLHVRTAAAPTGNNGLVYQTFEGANKPILEVVYQVTTAGAEATYNHAASQALYGRVFARTIIDRKILTSAEALLRATVAATLYALPRKSGSFQIRTDGLKIGQLITITFVRIPISGSFMIRRLGMRWITDSLVEYTVDFGDFRPDLISLLRKTSKLLIQ